MKVNGNGTKAMQVKPPNDADWGYAVRFARGMDAYRLPPACLARLLAVGALEYVEEKPKRTRDEIIKANKETLRKAAEELKSICCEKPQTRRLEELLNKLQEAREPIMCRRLQVSERGWAGLKNWGVEKPKVGERCNS